MTDNDRELIELAARAAGHRGFCYEDGFAYYWIEERTQAGVYPVKWNPLASDGDAFRLAVQLQIETKFLHGFKQVCCRRDVDRDNFEMHGRTGYGKGTDKEPTAENVRRAIVIAAAEIGRGMT